MKRAHIFVSGQVQGIGFRIFVKWQAQNLKLTGWVKNLPDGRVEAVFEGDEEKIKEMIKLCREGPPLAEVEEVEEKWEEAIGEFSGFEINLTSGPKNETMD